MYTLFLKRVLDLLIAAFAFIVLFPVFLAITVVLYIVNDRQPFFIQLRPGLNEKIFALYKFRTMNCSVGESGQLLPDAQRLTSVGKFLRRTSLDEIPQLINVIKGDMSLVGPRPLLPRYLPFYNSVEKLRHRIRPGITGWAQVNGRNVSSWNDRLADDVFYYRNLSFRLDAVIILKTIKGVFSAKDIIVDQDSYMNPLDVERAEQRNPAQSTF
jgi:undecaprenyl phosphate N,N'-diacetylbacillosamine 1-phosphate transferase